VLPFASEGRGGKAEFGVEDVGHLREGGRGGGREGGY
jgi:hypothetical protein